MCISPNPNFGSVKLVFYYFNPILESRYVWSKRYANITIGFQNKFRTVADYLEGVHLEDLSPYYTLGWPVFYIKTINILHRNRRLSKCTSSQLYDQPQYGDQNGTKITSDWDQTGLKLDQNEAKYWKYPWKKGY